MREVAYSLQSTTTDIGIGDGIDYRHGCKITMNTSNFFSKASRVKKEAISTFNSMQGSMLLPAPGWLRLMEAC